MFTSGTTTGNWFGRKSNGKLNFTGLRGFGHYLAVRDIYSGTAMWLLWQQDCALESPVSSGGSLWKALQDKQEAERRIQACYFGGTSPVYWKGIGRKCN